MSTTACITPIEECSAAFRGLITAIEREKSLNKVFPNRIMVSVILIDTLLQIHDGHRPEDVVCYHDSWDHVPRLRLSKFIQAQVTKARDSWKFRNHQFQLIVAIDKSLDHVLRYAQDSEVVGDILALAVEEFDSYRRSVNQVKQTLPELIDKYAEEFGLPC